MHWYSKQEYAISEHALRLRFTRLLALKALDQGLLALFCLVLLLLPVLVAWLPFLRRVTGARTIIFFGGMMLLPLQLAYAWHHPSHTLMPWLDHVIATLGIWPVVGEGEMYGFAQVPMSHATDAALSVAILFVFSAAAAALPWKGMWATRISQMSIFLVPFLLAYLVLLIPRAVQSQIFDRYLLGMVPLHCFCSPVRIRNI